MFFQGSYKVLKMLEVLDLKFMIYEMELKLLKDTICEISV